MSSERLPAPIAARVIDVTPRDRSVATMRAAVEDVQALASQPMTKQLRRFVFVWFRVFVLGVKGTKRERVDVRFPIPLPIVGGLLPIGLSRQKALRALAIAEASDDAPTAVSDYLDSVMGFELVRVDERKGPDRRELVVVGFD